TADGRLLREHKAGEDGDPQTAVYAFVLSLDGKHIAWCGRTGGILPSHIPIAKTNTLEVTHRIPAHDNDGRILAAYPEGFCSGSVDRTVKFWDWQTTRPH